MYRTPTNTPSRFQSNIKVSIDWKEQAKKDGRVINWLTKDAESVRGGLENLGYTWRFNTRTKTLEWNIDESGWRKSNDQIEGKIRDRLRTNFMYKGNQNAQNPTPTEFSLSWEDWKIVRGALSYDSETDPFLEWLDDLEEWDGVDRLDSLLEECFDIRDGQNEELVKWASRVLLIGAVERTYEPGAELHQMPVLVGGQNIGKGTFCKTLIPPEFREWGHKDFAFSNDDKKKYRK